jgi:hypothetical protein
MALGAGVIFEVETGGSDNSTGSAGVNGGGFDSGVTFAPGDLSATAGQSGTPTLAASNYQFAINNVPAGDVGAWVFIAGGTNWIPGWYQITSVNATTHAATVNAGIGAAVLYPSMMPNSTSGVATVGNPSGGQWALDYSQQSAAQVVIDNSAIKCTTPALSSNTLTFTQGYTPSERDLGNLVQITGGSNINAGVYEITAFVGSPTNTWTLAGAQALTKSTGAGSAITGGMGGAFASLGMGGSAAVAGNGAFVKTGSYNIAPGTPNASGARVTWPGGSSAAQGGFIIGYATVRGDFGAPPTLTATSSFTGATILTTGTGNYVANLIINGAGQGTTQGIATGTTGSTIYRCKVQNCTNNAINSGDAGSLVVLCELTGCSSQPAGVGGQWYFSAIHDNTGGGLSLGNVGNVVGFCLITSNTGTGMDGILFTGTGAGGGVFNSTVYNSGRGGIRAIGAGTVGIVLLNNLCVDNATINYDASSFTDEVLMVNNGWYGGGGGIGSNLSPNKIIGTVALTAFPFVNALANNFALNTTTGGGATATAAGIGAGTALVPGLPTPTYIDLGAAQVSSSPTVFANQQVATIDQIRQTGQFTVTTQTINFGKAVTSTTVVNTINDQAVYQGLLWAGGRYTFSGGGSNPCLFNSPDGINWTEQTGAVNFATGDAEVRTLFASADGNLYLGTSALITYPPKIFKYNGATWVLQTVAGTNPIPTTQAAVRSMADGPDGLVYASMVATGGNAPQLWNDGGISPNPKWQQVAATPWTSAVTTVTLGGIPGPTMYASTDNVQAGGAGAIYSTQTPGTGSSWSPINTTFFTTVGSGAVEAHKLVLKQATFMRAWPQVMTCS